MKESEREKDKIFFSLVKKIGKVSSNPNLSNTMRQ